MVCQAAYMSFRLESNLGMLSLNANSFRSFIFEILNENHLLCLLIQSPLMAPYKIWSYQINVNSAESRRHTHKESKSGYTYDNVAS